MLFNAQQHAPVQGVPVHPVGMGFDAVITDTKKVPTGVTQDNPHGTGASFNVEFTTPAGKITNRYNLWNNNAKTVEISIGQLSALCHVTGVMQIDLSDQASAAGVAGAALRNARCKIDVVQQYETVNGERKATQYTQIGRVLDIAGNEPGKASAGQVAPQQPQVTQQQPMQQNPNGGWAQPQQQPNPNSAPANAWTQPQQNQQPQQQPPNQWQPGNNGGPAQSPPWSANK